MAQECTERCSAIERRSRLPEQVHTRARIEGITHTFTHKLHAPRQVQMSKCLNPEVLYPSRVSFAAPCGVLICFRRHDVRLFIRQPVSAVNAYQKTHTHTGRRSLEIRSSETDLFQT